MKLIAVAQGKSSGNRNFHLTIRRQKMGLFDKVVSIVGDNMSGGAENKGLMEQALNLINNPAIGGLPGLINKFQNGGLGDIISSWVGTGANQPISADQIINALGADRIHEIANKLGVADNQVSDGLASVLPQIIDKLTPNGKVPEGDVLKQGIDLLSTQFLNR
jgi:uncharacterized protein YidB (DUF937 family)